MLIAILTLTSLTAHAAAADPVRVLVVTGGHGYETSFYTLFEGYADVKWNHAVSNTDAFARDLRDRYDVLVLYDMVQELGEKGREHLRHFLESGKGLVVLHHAILNYQDWPWWYETVVGGRYLVKPEGDLAASSYRHDEQMTLRAVGEHPITRGIETIEIEDETYRDVWIAHDVTPLLETDNPTSDRIVAWTSPYEKSRVVYIQPGHGSPAHRNDGYRRLVYNALMWAAGRTER